MEGLFKDIIQLDSVLKNDRTVKDVSDKSGHSQKVDDGAKKSCSQFPTVPDAPRHSKTVQRSVQDGGIQDSLRRCLTLQDSLRRCLTLPDSLQTCQRLSQKSPTAVPDTPSRSTTMSRGLPDSQTLDRQSTTVTKGVTDSSDGSIHFQTVYDGAKRSHKQFTTLPRLTTVPRSLQDNLRRYQTLQDVLRRCREVSQTVDDGAEKSLRQLTTVQRSLPDSSRRCQEVSQTVSDRVRQSKTVDNSAMRSPTVPDIPKQSMKVPRGLQDNHPLCQTLQDNLRRRQTLPDSRRQFKKFYQTVSDRARPSQAQSRRQSSKVPDTHRQ
ncbi:hypothetical protein DPMN_059488 [Dreissena polymorpha]|uniref:Uncharacterized protein n=1 Tax=Dreissena polymorpha TaxID=45954 RepID=A0A9D4C497_DREPO|nr:hypothetical protein DPMN_059488 [Dreissena polymorpha]